MGKVDCFDIILSNPRGEYFAGQNIEGQVIVVLNEEITVQGILLKFKGKAVVEWTQQETTSSGLITDDDSRTDTVTRIYSAKEEYFKEYLNLLCSRQGRGATRLPAGHHTFPFCFFLPPNLPSSFEGAYGHVRYSMKGICDRTGRFDNTIKRSFTVIGILDLNAYPSAKLPVHGRNEKTLCCLCCASGPITAEFRLEHRGYVPGEAILLYANIHNDSDTWMNKSYVSLKMVTTFHAQGGNKNTATKEVGRIEEGPIDAGESFSWKGRPLVIPPGLTPSYLLGYKIIDIRYILQLNVDPAGPGFDLKVPLEIIIGTIRLRSMVKQCPPHVPPLMPPPQVGYPLRMPSSWTEYPPPAGNMSPGVVLAPPVESAVMLPPPATIYRL